MRKGTDLSFCILASVKVPKLSTWFVILCPFLAYSLRIYNLSDEGNIIEMLTYYLQSTYFLIVRILKYKESHHKSLSKRTLQLLTLQIAFSDSLLLMCNCVPI